MKSNNTIPKLCIMSTLLFYLFIYLFLIFFFTFTKAKKKKKKKKITLFYSLLQIGAEQIIHFVENDLTSD